MRAAILRRLAAGLFTSLSLCAAAQSPHVAWAVSTYGPGTGEATVGGGGNASDQRAMAVDAAGNVFVAGYIVAGGANDMFTVKYDGATGNILWQKPFDGTGMSWDQAWAMALDGAGNAIVTGYTWTGLDYDIKTIKYAAGDGAVLWEKTFTGPMAGIDFGIAIGVDAVGNVFVGGNVGDGVQDDLKIIKFAAADGAVVWDKTFSGAAGLNDYVFALAVDSAGNVIVTGEEQKSATDSDWKTIKYAAADGAILWQASYAGAAMGLDIPLSIRVDAANNVVIAGHTFNGTNADGKVIKYAGANGAVLWEKTFAGVGAGDDFFYSVALDAAGNAIAAGFTFAAAGGNDWNVVKYAAANGAVMWQKTVGGSGNLSDVAVTVAVDAQGHAIVGGRINNSADPANRDMHAVKLAASDGSLIWSYTYAGSAGGFDRVAAVASSAGAAYLAGESLETGNPAGWRIVKLDDPPVEAHPDFNASGTSDLVFTHADGRVAVWLMNGGTVAGNATIMAAGSGFGVKHIADMDGDGRSDLVWQHTDGRVVVWLMNGTATVGGGTILGANAVWTVAHTGDFNGDGRADILWRHANGTYAIWLMNGAATVGGGTILAPGSGFTATRVADFNGDGRDDILWTHADGRVAIWFMNGSAITGGGTILAAGSGWSAIQAGDFNGDGKADIVWRHTDGRVAMWLMDGASVIGGGGIFGGGTAWTVAHVADFNGDGRDDLLWSHPDGRAVVWLMDGATATTQAQLLGAGGGWIARRTGDLNGDGKADIVWQNADGRVDVWLMNGAAALGSTRILGSGTGFTVSSVSP